MTHASAERAGRSILNKGKGGSGIGDIRGGLLGAGKHR
jgi:hypothetical protein